MPKNIPKKIVQAVAESPARAVEASVEATKAVTKKAGDIKPVKAVQRYIDSLGPGLTTGAADDDPSGIATYSQAGSEFGYRYLWLALFSLPFMALVQEMCARVGIATGRGLAGILKTHYAKWILVICTILLFTANTVNIGADIGAMAASINLILPKAGFIMLAVLCTVLSLGLQIFMPYHKYAKYLKYLTLVLFAYVIAFFMVAHSWKDIALDTLIPHLSFNKDTLYLVVAILGTTISPYLFFWEASQEVEKEIDKGVTNIEDRKNEATEKTIGNMRKDVYSGMIFSNLAMFFIIGLAASTLHANGITNIATTREAAEALRPLAGNATYYLFTLGVVGTGLLAIPVLAGSASYAISETMGWRGSLSHKLKEDYGFYGIIIIAVILGLIINYFSTDPIRVLIFAAVLNGLIAPVLIALITLVSSNKNIMGPWVNGPWRKTLAWLAVVLMGGVGLIMILSLIVPNLLI